MAFKYINPGFNIGDLATMSMYTATNAESSSRTKLSDTGAFFLPSATKCVFLSLTCTLGRIWYTLFYNGSGAKETGINFDNYIGTIRLNGANNTKTAELPSGIANWYVQVVSDESAGKLVIYRNGIQVFDYTGNVMGGDEIGKIAFKANQRTSDYIANIIISDEYFPPTEKIVALTAANTTATMTDNGDGSYSADEVGKSVMQTIDTAALTTAIGQGNTITGFSLIGNPAYYEGDGITRLDAMNGENVKGTAELPTVTTGKILASWRENIAQADLSGISLGWKARA